GHHCAVKQALGARKSFGAKIAGHKTVQHRKTVVSEIICKSLEEAWFDHEAGAGTPARGRRRPLAGIAFPIADENRTMQGFSHTMLPADRHGFWFALE